MSAVQPDRRLAVRVDTAGLGVVVVAGTLQVP